jgi:hypothetical protein
LLPLIERSSLKTYVCTLKLLDRLRLAVGDVDSVLFVELYRSLVVLA